ncbi:hypothetical protein [Pelagibius sp. Alg239-R121]|uniref:hypothetical protein n=1 Tax=Pelagibius sp. Alg239-R121 TaxID=2993448 RepID=UPI0024A732A6|nr:hypothetical protein [Pelagibius sp. Alg239-R121]
MVSPAAARLLTHDAGALMTRLEQVKPFALHMPMVGAAAPAVAARQQIEIFLESAKHRLTGMLSELLAWLNGPGGKAAEDHVAQRRFTVVRLQFQKLLTQFDLFADVLTQRSEHEFGVWLAGLDVLADDALAISQAPYRSPPLLCYLDRGIGAAIRRARTRLPGGGLNPVAIIRVPRERMVGSSVGGSLVHEVGHQGAALLGLVDSLRPALQAKHEATGRRQSAWKLWERWISEIVADYWSVAQLGIGATYGMIGVVALPRAFIFRLSLDDPHPPPWVRVRLSATLGRTLYPDPQWDDLLRVWSRLYPPGGLDPRIREVFRDVEQSIPDFVALLVSHRPAALRGRSLREIFPLADRQPKTLRSLAMKTKLSARRLTRLKPTAALAVLGQARADSQISPEDEARVAGDLLRTWAIQRQFAKHCGCSH